MISKKTLKITTIVGTRPEIIRLSVLIKKLDQLSDHRLLFSSQNRQAYVGYDFFNELGLRKPDSIMENSSNSTAEFLASLLVFTENEIKNNRPDAVVILGDTNTALASIVVRKFGVPIYHLEAGNRSFDSNVPEESNRKIVDHISDFNLAYSNYAYQNLLTEGISPRNSIVIGTPLREVIGENLSKITDSKILDKLGLKPRDFFVVSCHRQENIDSPERLSTLITSLVEVANAFNKPLIVSSHPRLQAMMQKGSFKEHDLIRFLPPFGFLDYCKLQSESILVLSDSGSISEESSILNFRALTLRDSMERPEALESASIEMTGLESDRVISAIRRVLQNRISVPTPQDYEILNTSDRVINFILSTYHVRNTWMGIR